MPSRKPKKIEEQKPTSCLRRSPRFHRQNQTGPLSPTTPKPAETRRRRPDSFSTPVSQIKKTDHGVLENEGASNSDKSRYNLRRSARLERRANFSCPNLRNQCMKEKRQTRSSVRSEKSVEGSRTSRRRDGGANVGISRKVVSLPNEGVMEKRVTRSSVRRHKVVIKVDSDSEGDFDDSNFVVSKEGKSKAGVDCIEKNAGKTEKRVTRCSSRIDKKNKADNVLNANRRKAVVLDEVEHRGGDELSEKDASRKDVEDCGIMKKKGEQNCTRKAQIGGKRKRDGVEEECGIARGWTKEQECSLHRAYFTAKPTPQFWKKVARMVPGKSAEECFERIHFDHSTPPQPKTRSRAKLQEPSPLSFSPSKLLSPAKNKSKLGAKRRKLLAQKTVRQILQKQQKEDQDYNADIFALLEPTMDTSPINLEAGTTFASPPPSKVSSFLTAFKPTSSSSQRQHLSRLKSCQRAAFASPPVLKQIKNKALHEKYIDQLHCRDAKRKAEAVRNSRNIRGQIDEKATHLKQDLVKTAKDALVSDAQDAISKFRSLQCRIDEDEDEDDSSSNRSDDEDDGRL